MVKDDGYDDCLHYSNEEESKILLEELRLYELMISKNPWIANDAFCQMDDLRRKQMKTHLHYDN